MSQSNQPSKQTKLYQLDRNIRQQASTCLLSSLVSAILSFLSMRKQYLLLMFLLVKLDSFLSSDFRNQNFNLRWRENTNNSFAASLQYLCLQISLALLQMLS